MKRLAALIPITVTLLTACPAPTPVPPEPVTLTTLTLTGVTSPVAIDSSTKLTVTATGSDGKPFAGTATLTSSEPNAVSVAADGTLTARHLSSSPVMITATQGGKTATLNVSTYGLDATGGTYTSLYKSSPSVYSASDFLAAFKDASGAKAASGAVTVQGPAAYNNGKPVSFDLSTTLGISDFPQAVVPAPVVTGTYVATLTVGSVVYKKTFVLDASKVLTPPSNFTLNVTTVDYTLTGSAPSGATGGVKLIVFGKTGSSSAETLWKQTLPASGTWTNALASDTYVPYIIASSSLISPTAIFADQLNLSDYQLDDVVIP